MKDEKIAELCSESKVRKIKDVCRTRYDDQYTLQSFSFYNGNIRQFRWVERLDALDTISTLLEPVVATLEQIKGDRNFNSESITKANGLYHFHCQSNFIVAVIVCKETLAYTKALTIKLQGKQIELMEAYKSVQLVKDTIAIVRNEVDEYHIEWFNVAEGVAEKLDIEIQRHQSCGHQINRSNVCATNMRSTISQDRLNGLALLHVHYSMHIDLDEVIDL